MSVEQGGRWRSVNDQRVTCHERHLRNFLQFDFCGLVRNKVTSKKKIIDGYLASRNKIVCFCRNPEKYGGTKTNWIIEIFGS